MAERERSGGATDRHYELLDQNFGGSRFQERGVGVPAARRFADRAYVDDAGRTDLPIEGDVAAAADDDVRDLVAEQALDFLVAHVVADRLGRVVRRAVHDEELTPGFDGDTQRPRQFGEAHQDELAELSLRRAQPFEAPALVVGRGAQVVGVDRREGLVADP